MFRYELKFCCNSKLLDKYFRIITSLKTTDMWEYIHLFTLVLTKNSKWFLMLLKYCCGMLNYC